MKQKEAEGYIRRLYCDDHLKDNEPVDINSGPGVLPFYLRLKNNHPEALKFRGTGDRHQTIAGWFS